MVPTASQIEIWRENRLRTITDQLVQSDELKGGGSDRMERIQSAYRLAQKIDTLLMWAWEHP
jgi:hypothetical protein